MHPYGDTVTVTKMSLQALLPALPRAGLLELLEHTNLHGNNEVSKPTGDDPAKALQA